MSLRARIVRRAAELLEAAGVPEPPDGPVALTALLDTLTADLLVSPYLPQILRGMGAERTEWIAWAAAHGAAVVKAVVEATRTELALRSPT